MNTRLNWDHEDAEVHASAGHEDAEVHASVDLDKAEAAIFEIEELAESTDQVKQAEAARIKHRMLEFKARFTLLLFI